MSVLAEANSSDGILTQSFGMEVARRLPIRRLPPTIDAPEAFETKATLPETWTPVGYGGDALPIHSLCITAKGAAPKFSSQWP
jgi:hypothetical protein